MELRPRARFARAWELRYERKQHRTSNEWHGHELSEPRLHMHKTLKRQQAQAKYVSIIYFLIYAYGYVLRAILNFLYKFFKRW